jgi:hypothetical protein
MILKLHLRNLKQENHLAFKILNYGEAGTGKTYSTATLLGAGQKLRFLAAENNAIAGIQAAMKEYLKQIELKKRPALLAPDQFSMMIPARPKKTLADLAAQQTKFVGTTLESQFKTADPQRNKYTRYLEVLKSTVAFKDSTTGVDYGSVDDWGDDTTLVIDSLTIICEAIMSATVGGKLAISQPEWGVMQKTLVEFMRLLTEDLTCNLVILGHPTKEIDPVLGITRIYPANLGQALNNLLPSFFTEVVWSYRKGQEFLWSTDHKQAVTRQTVLPLKESMPQDFAQCFRK